MADKSSNLSLNLPVSTDFFDHDLFLRQNFQTIDTKLKANIVQEFTAIAGQTIFTLSNAYTMGKGELSVEVDGVKQKLGSGYNETTPTSITILEGLSLGAKVKITIIGLSPGDDSRIDQINTQLSDMAVDLKSFTDLKVSVAQGYDWSPAFDSAIAKAKSLGVKLRVPSGTYYISRPIDISGLVIEGDETSVFNTASMGTWILCLTKDFSALKQVSNSTANLTFNVKNIIIQDANIGLETGYSVNSSFENLFFNNCTLAIKHGDSTVIGSLFNTFKNIYTKGCTKGIDINGSQWANNNVFINCFFSGSTYAATIDCNGGIGAVNNTFIACEFQSDTGFGIQLGSTRGTNLDSCYYEANAAAIVWNKYQEGTIVRGGTYGSLRNDNSLGHSAFIVASATAGGYFFIDSPYVYLPVQTVNSVEVSANLNFIDVSAVSGLSGNVRFGHTPRLEGTPTNFNIMKGVTNYNVKKATGFTGESKSAPHFILKNDDETYGFDLYRNRGNGGTGFGVKAKLNNIDIFNFDENGYMTLNKAMALTPITASSSIPNNSFYVDSTSNTLKFKDNTGTVKTVTLT